MNSAAVAATANLAAHLEQRAAAHPQRLAIVECRGTRVRRRTFGELADAVARVAAGLRRRGLARGDRVLIFIPMSLDLYIALLAIHHAGGCAVFVDAWVDRPRLDAAVRAARPRMFLGTARAHLLRLLSPALRAIPLAVVAGGARPIERLGCVPVEPVAARGVDDEALVTFTTGSTGVPKAAVRTHGFLWAQHEALQRHLELHPDDVDLPTLPVFVLNNLATGVTSVLPDFDPRRPADIDPARIHAQIEAEHVTTTSGSPAFYARLADWCRARGLRLPVRALFTGGAPVLPPLARLLADTVEGRAHVVYGSTEVEPIAGIEARAMLDAMTSGGEGICVGVPVKDVEVKLIRAHDGPVDLDAGGWTGWEVAAGDVGEIVVAGAHVLGGYLGDPGAERRNKIRDGAKRWHRTGDAAWRDSQGRLWLMGRIRRRVRRAGKTWWPQPAELAALAVHGVRHAAYFGVPDHELGERAVLCAESDRPHDELEAPLRQALGAMPADDLHVVSRIPRDPRHQSKTDTDKLVALLGVSATSREHAGEASQR